MRFDPLLDKEHTYFLPNRLISIRVRGPVTAERATIAFPESYCLLSAAEDMQAEDIREQILSETNLIFFK